MKKSISKFLSILSLFVIISCHKDDVVQKGTITFTVNDSYYNYWIVLSDQSGKVLDWKAMTNDVTQIFSFTQTKDSVNISLINKGVGGNNFFTIKTFVKIAPGDYSIINTSDQTASPAGSYTIDASSDSYTNYYPQSENACGYAAFSPGNTKCVLPLCSNNSNLFCFVVGNGADTTPRYIYNASVNPGETLILNNDLFNQLPLMKNKTISLGKPTVGGIASAAVVGNTIQKKKAFIVSEFIPSNEVSNLPLYYPDLTGTLFSNYLCELLYSTQLNICNIITKESQEPLDSYPELNVSLNMADSSSITTSKISFNPTGSAHYTLTTFDYHAYTSIPYDATWYIYSNFSNQTRITLPQFPDDLKAAVDLSFIGKLKRNEVAIVEDNSLGGYASFYQSQLNNGGSINSEKPADKQQRIFLFENPGTIITGRAISKRLSKYKSIRN